MEIVRSNFEERLPIVLKAIDEASFVSIDTEFTGIGERRPDYENGVDRYFEDLCVKARDFQIMQFGLAAFSYNKSTESFQVKSFSFYLFPRQFNRGYDRRFLCQSSSLEVLSKSNFDFKKWVDQGVPYLQREEEKRQKGAIEEKFCPISSLRSLDPTAEKFFADKEIRKKLTSFVEGKGENPSILQPSVGNKQRMWIHKLVMATPKFRNNVVMETHFDDKDTFLKLWRVNNESERKHKTEEIKRAELEELDKASGFSKVIRKITETGKLVVGHNMKMDLLHCVNHFHCNMPKTVPQFREQLHKMFPEVIDTKHLATSDQLSGHISFENTRLDKLKEVLGRPPFRKHKYEMAEGFKEYISDTMHDASYDAFLTGLCFIGMADFIDNLDGKPRSDFSPNSYSVAMKPFIGKVFLPLENPSYLDLQPSQRPLSARNASSMFRQKRSARSQHRLTNDF